MPKRDLYVSPEQLFTLTMYLSGPGIGQRHQHCDAKCDQAIRYFHIELAAHDVIYAEGAAAETYIDCDNRGMFQNAAEVQELIPTKERRSGNSAPRSSRPARDSRRSSASFGLAPSKLDRAFPEWIVPW